ncbi:MAG: enoyl-CoA hydratase/isomerase family protein [Deltaproteobacteria bacterium]|nr:enoyl-CoA hydratase/isomerase family protein [Deltaproteobacteria bacterium]
MANTKNNLSEQWPLKRPPRLGDPLPSKMAALTIRRDLYGPPSRAIHLETLPVPRLRPQDANCVLVSILASGPNYNTNFAALGLPVPPFVKGDAASIHIPGSDALGIVVDAGPAVTRLKVGQAVILDSWTGRNIRGYETHDGFNAQFALIEERRALAVGDALRNQSPEQLSALLLTYGTAYRVVVERLRVKPGDSVLVMGGGKGTSFAGAQLAKALGGRVILIGSNPTLAKQLISRGIADAFIDRRTLPGDVFGVLPRDQSFEQWRQRSEPFRAAVRESNQGRLVDKVFEHTGGENFPLLVSSLAPGGTLAFFGATGKGLKGEYKETFFYEGRRFVMDARWVWMRQKQILFRRGSAAEILDEVALLPGRKVLVWGADAYAQDFVQAARHRAAIVVVLASYKKERDGIDKMARLGIGSSHLLDRDQFEFPEDMADPLNEAGSLNPAYGPEYMKHAQALGKALWAVFGQRQSPDLVVDRIDQSTLHYSTFVARDFDETDAFRCGIVVLRGPSDLSIRGSHMYCSEQAADVVRLLSSRTLVMQQEDLELTDLAGIATIQQQMLDGKMKKPKGVALVQADRPGRAISHYEDSFRGEALLVADPSKERLIDVRVTEGIALVTLTRPDALNALNDGIVSQLSEIVRELAQHGTVSNKEIKALIITGAGRSFVAGADVNAFFGKQAETIEKFANKNIAVFSALENLQIPVVALIDGFALGGGNELAMSCHYRLVSENAQLGQPEVKLGFIPGYGGLQRLPRLVGPTKAAAMCANGEPINAQTALEIGLADAFAPSATALSRAFEVARAFVRGERPLPRKQWDLLAERQKAELDELLAMPEIRSILQAPTPDKIRAEEVRAARLAAARDVLLAIRAGYELGFEPGLRNDARLFGAIASSPGGQEWIARFLAKDPQQSSFLTLLSV